MQLVDYVEKRKATLMINENWRWQGWYHGWMTIEGTEGKLRMERDGKIYYTPQNGVESEHIYEIPQIGKTRSVCFLVLFSMANLFLLFENNEGAQSLLIQPIS